jgi:hypothetical protein
MVKFCYSKFAAGNQGGLRQGMPKVTPAEIRAAVVRPDREPAEALEWRLGAATERRRNLQPSGWGGCQEIHSSTLELTKNILTRGKNLEQKTI